MSDNSNHRRPRILVDPSTPQSELGLFDSPFTATESTWSSPMTPQASFSTKVDPSFYSVLDHLRTPLYPLISTVTGLQHPEFPATLLAYHLLTSEQLDDLARHYHQVYPPVAATTFYPVTIPAWVGTANEKKVDIETKRRRFGRFIGFRGCESPVARENPQPPPVEETREEMLARMEREWQESLLRARLDSEAALRLKQGPK